MRRRILVAQAPTYWPPTDEQKSLPIQVGVLPWQAARPMLTVIVKLTFTYGEGAVEDVPPKPMANGSLETRRIAVVAEEPALLSPTRPLQDPSAAPGECSYGSDFVPRKKNADVLLTGAARPRVASSAADRGKPVAKTHRCRFRIDDHTDLSFLVRGKTDAIALRPRNVRGLTEDAELPLGPTAPAESAALEDVHPGGFDYSSYNVAPPYLQTDRIIRGGAKFTLEGLSERADRLIVELPGLVPRVIVDPSGPGTELLELPMLCDTLHIDLDRELILAVYRGEIPIGDPDAHLVDRLLVGLIPDMQWAGDEPARFVPLLAELPRGRFCHATTREDAEAGTAPPELTEEELAMARYETWDCPEGPMTSIELEQYAAITAELAEQREPREDVLRKHDFDDYWWGVEERAWTTELSAEAPDEEGDETIAERYAKQFVIEQEKLASPGEENFPVDRYAELSVLCERGDPSKVLGEHQLTIGKWMRIDRRFATRTTTDAAFNRELSAELEAARERLGPAPSADEMADGEMD